MGERANIPLPSTGVDLCVILVRPEVPGNIGAVARSMLNFGYSDLRLVASLCDLDGDEVRKRAKHARIVLDNACSLATWDEAVADCSMVIGTSGKRETGERVVFRSLLSPSEAVSRASKRIGDKVALVFGPEGVGLSQEELASCDILSTLATWEGYPILNLSHAVTLFLQTFHSSRLTDPEPKDGGLEDHTVRLDALDPELRRALVQAMNNFGEVLPGPEHRLDGVSDVLRRVVLRGTPQSREAHRLIGAFIDATTALRYLSGDERWRRERRRRLQPDDFGSGSFLEEE